MAKFKHEWKTRQYERRKLFLAEYKLTRGCQDCRAEISDHEVLTFDHVRGEKSFGIGQKWDVSMESLLSELAKCEVVCHNCHARRTARRLRSEPAYEPFQKIPRLNREMVITEKIDGTNGCIVVDGDGDVIAAQRNGWVPDTSDNFGFRLWVEANEDALREVLGVGVHRGEWWGPGIQRGYGLAEKRFSLFHPRWHEVMQERLQAGAPWVGGLDVVPVLYEGTFSTQTVNAVVYELKKNGSRCSPGFMRPEGVIVFHTAAGQYFKVTCEGDEKPKGVK